MVFIAIPIAILAYKTAGVGSPIPSLGTTRERSPARLPAFACYLSEHGGVESTHGGEMDFEIIGGRWRKCKGAALVRSDTGEIYRAEIHWYEAHGYGRKELKEKQRIG